MRSSGRSWLVPLAMILVLSVCIAIAGNETASNLTANETTLQNVTNPFEKAMGRKPAGKR